MNILHWSETCLPDACGGIEVFLSHLLECQARRGHRVALVTNAPSASAACDGAGGGIETHRMPFTAALQSRNTAIVARTLDAVRALKERFKPDIVHIHTHVSGVFFHVRTRTRWTCPDVVTVHTLELLGDPVGTLQAELYGGAARIACVSEFVRSNFLRLAPAFTDATGVVWNGTPLTNPAPGLPAASARKRLFIGCRLVEEKGVQHAIAAMPAILERHPDATLTVAGDGPFRPALESLAESHGVAGRVRFTGVLSAEEIRARLASSGIALVPSVWQEPFGIAAIEAANARRALVLTRTGGLAGLFDDGTEARHVAPGCAHALACAVIDLLDDPPLADRLATAARTKAGALYSIEHAANAYDALYAELAPDAAGRQHDSREYIH
jgi:glycogen(starch) synthase